MRLAPEYEKRATELMALYPQRRSALLPMLHVLQEQDGHLTEDGMEHIAELVGLLPAEVLSVASFYDMFKLEPVGRYVLGICTNIACMLEGAEELLHHAEERLGVASGATTSDGEFTLEEVECVAFCGDAPCLAVNWRYFGKVSNADFDRLVDDLRTGRLADRVPPHGTLNRVRRKVDMVTVPSGGQPVGRVSEEDRRLQRESPPLAPVGITGEEDPANPRATATAPSQARTIRVAGDARSKGPAQDDGDDESQGGTE